MNDRLQDDKPASTEGKTLTASDLAFLLPLIGKIKAVEIKFHEAGDGAGPPKPRDATAVAVTVDAEARLQALERELAALKNERAGQPVIAAAHRELLPYTWQRAATAAVLIVASLVFAHWLAVFVYDTSTVTLRLLSMVIPATVAACATWQRMVKPQLELALALAVGIAAVLAMSYVTSVLENTTPMPENVREWRETIEYIASITFAYFTGVLISGAVRVRRPDNEGAVPLIALITSRVINSGQPLQRNLEGLNKFIATLMPVVTALVALITGLKSILH